MLSNITIGQYYPAKSVLHRLDARMKVVLTAVFIVLIFLANRVASMALVLAFLGVTIALSRVPLKMILRGLKAVVIIVLLTALLNLFYVREGRTLVDVWIIHITTQGVYTAVFMAVRIMALIVSSSLLTYTTTPTNLTDGLERLLSPLRHLRVPVHDIAMMMTIALRFIPLLIDEVGRIMNAQKARGADLETGNLFQRAKALVPIFIPLFISAFRRAYELAFAMDCRCYRGGEGRTRMKQMKLAFRDIAALLIMAVVLAGVLVINHFLPPVV
ncbi:MAG TPA: energy-coupling factor transporter transmembrane protein EcfT [Candidatus Fimivicinus intestinavium]|nr:energy-coupling factor transporter transmembrane protein EcfT [Candidatus Fimivicinus intestinavium]